MALPGACCKAASEPPVTAKGLPKACAARSELLGACWGPACAGSLQGACLAVCWEPAGSGNYRRFAQGLRYAPGAVTTEGLPKACAARSEPAGRLL